MGSFVMFLLCHVLKLDLAPFFRDVAPEKVVPPYDVLMMNCLLNVTVYRFVVEWSLVLAVVNYGQSVTEFDL